MSLSKNLGWLVDLYFVVGLYFFILGGSHFYGIFIQTTLIGAVEKYSTFMTPSNNLLLHLYSSVFCSCQTIKWKRRNLAATNDFFFHFTISRDKCIAVRKILFCGLQRKENMDLENQKTVVRKTMAKKLKLECGFWFLVLLIITIHHKSGLVFHFSCSYISISLQVDKKEGLTDDIIWPQMSPPIIFHSFDNKVMAKPTHVP